ncbi:zinc ribbon domain-containing protein [Caldalkalibacillus salinus]|uniref:zinc ribbon domain-containing protein n=1 Tax=Caldalkalibacillus salinus TaxID=2803787 RepID=UPI0019216DCA|nr:zinc ribbon domain-containing protein [Caldalkalibacillus salinus]
MSEIASNGKGCIKCGHTEAETKEIATTGTGLSKMFDIQHNRFMVVYCTHCGYSEFYNKDANRTSDVIDFFFGG